MSKLFALLACILFVASVESSRAAPLDSPGTVYIDGVPCNLPCQSYMAWSRRVRSQDTAPAVSPSASRQIVQRSQKTKTQRTAKAQASVATKAALGRVAKNVAAKNVVSRPIEAAPADTAPQPTREAEKTASSHKTDSSEKTDTPAASNPAQGAEGAKAPDQVTTGSAEANSSTATATTHPEKTTPPEQEAKGNTDAAPSAISPPASTDATAPPAGTDSTALALAKVDERIAILVVATDIKSVSDLSNKVIAINEVPSEYSAADIKSAIAAAGAADVQMSENQTMALTRLIDGDVQAAIATVVSPIGADAWNSFPGFNVLRVPLPSPSEKEKRG
jgi:hypothetical protein